MAVSQEVVLTKTYSELSQLTTFLERYNYLQLKGNVGIETFGWDRYLNQLLYNSSEWKSARRKVIIRDEGCDLGIEDYPIESKIIIHHINPLTKEMINNRDKSIFDLNNLICCSHKTHNAIHYGDENLLPKEWTPRTPNDMIPWR